MRLLLSLVAKHVSGLHLGNVRRMLWGSMYGEISWHPSHFSRVYRVLGLPQGTTLSGVLEYLVEHMREKKNYVNVHIFTIAGSYECEPFLDEACF